MLNEGFRGRKFFERSSGAEQKWWMGYESHLK